MIQTVVVPALTFVQPDGRLDGTLIRAYIELASRTWIDRFLLSGSATRGDRLTVAGRARVLDLWLTCLPPGRLVACCWEPADLTQAQARGVQPMLVLRDLPGAVTPLAAVAALPAGSLVYSHPMYTRTPFDAQLAAAAWTMGALPAGGKFAKISLTEIQALRAATGPGFALWDGSSRHIDKSMAAGASGVVATPLSCLPTPFPARSALQAAVDAVQHRLDALPGRAERTALLLSSARSTIIGSAGGLP